MTEMNSYYPVGGEGNERGERSEQGPWIVEREREKRHTDPEREKIEMKSMFILGLSMMHND